MSHSSFHDRQREEMARAFNDESRSEIHDSWLDEGSADFWRHKRMYEMISPLASEYVDSRWLTVGDGRFGLDAYRMKKMFGISSILPTDISGVTLEEGVRRKLIDEFSVENAEDLSFEDEAFDVVFCKESYHHLPRAVVGLYEMLRVAKHAVILIEPQWWRRKRLVVNPRKLLPKLLKDLFLRRPSDLSSYVSEGQYRAGYEPSGNYIYTVSRSEVEQIVRGVDLPGFAYKGFVDAYEKGVEFARADENDALFSRLRDEIESKEMEFSAESHLSHPMACFIIFKTLPSEAVREELAEKGYELNFDTRNPMVAGSES